MDETMLIQVLTWFCVVLATAVVALVVFIVVRVFDTITARNKKDDDRWTELGERLTREFLGFGAQLDEVRRLNTDANHSLELRIRSIEEWRKGMEMRQPGTH